MTKKYLTTHPCPTYTHSYTGAGPYAGISELSASAHKAKNFLATTGPASGTEAGRRGFPVTSRVTEVAFL